MSVRAMAFFHPATPISCIYYSPFFSCPLCLLPTLPPTFSSNTLYTLIFSSSIGIHLACLILILC